VRVCRADNFIELVDVRDVLEACTDDHARAGFFIWRCAMPWLHAK